MSELREHMGNGWEPFILMDPATSLALDYGDEPITEAEIGDMERDHTDKVWMTRGDHWMQIRSLFKNSARPLITNNELLDKADAILAKLDELLKEMDEKKMKPKVNWRCLKTDAPKTDGRYWFAGKSGCVELLWLDSKSYGDAYARGTLDELLRLQWVKWAHYEAPEPPPKPTPFEAWWDGLERVSWAGRSEMRGVQTENEGKYAASKCVAKATFLAGYEACAKNMVNGGCGGAK